MRRKITIIALSLIACICLVLCLTSCKDDEAESLYKPVNIEYDGSRLTWEKVLLAEHYTVSINGGEAKRVNTNIFTYDAAGKNFDVTVSSVIQGKTFRNDMHFIALDKIASIIVSNTGEISWNAVVGASAYRISVNGETLTEDVTDTSYTPNAGNNRIKIRPIVANDNSYYSSWSDEKQVYINEAPQAISYDGETITWRGSASKYIVCINGEAQQTESAPLTGTKYSYQFKGKEMTISIKALGDHVTTFDSASTEKTYHYLQSVTDFDVEDGILKWNAVDGAEGYQIKINNFVQNVNITTTSYDKLTPNQLLEIEVRPYNNSGNYFSSWSVSKNFQILGAPVIDWNTDWDPDAEDVTNNVFWNSVGNEEDYTVIVEKDGQIILKEDVDSNFAYPYNVAGSYTVKVRANATAGSAWSSSKFSNPIEVIRLEGPKAAGADYIKSDKNDLSKGFTVAFDKVTNASRYQLYLLNGSNSTPITGASTTKNSLTYGNYTSETEQTYNYMVKSEGETGIKYVSGIKRVTLPCTYDAALHFEIKIQAMPSKPIVTGTTASWEGGGENGCVVRCDSQPINADNSTSADISFLNAGTHQLTVCAKGNGADVLASKYTPTITVIRIVAPTGIKITGGASDGQLLFNGVTGASGYNIYFNGSANSINYNDLDGIRDYIVNNGTSVEVVALADTSKNEEDLFYVDSAKSAKKNFICMNAPTFSSTPFDENMVNLRWNKPSNITSNFTPSYDVYNFGTAIDGGEDIRATSVNIASLSAGQHQFKVKAKGDGEHFLDSEFSIVLAVEKLAKPTMKVQDNMYVWDAVDNVTSYSLKIDGVEAVVVLQETYKQYSYSPAGKLTAIKSYSVELFAKGNGRTTINSDKFAFSQMVDACIAPEISFEYSHEQVTHGGTINIAIIKDSPNNNDYYYEVGGSSGKFVSSISVSVEDTGVYSIRAKALGGAFSDLPDNGIIGSDYKGKFYIDSQYTISKAITLLGYPSSAFGVSGISLNNASTLKWSIVNDANGYDYQISLDNGDFSEVKHSGANSIARDAYLPEGMKHTDYQTVTIRVRASSNGSINLVSSQWVEYTWTNPNK